MSALFSYIIEDNFFGQKLKFDFVRSSFPKIQTLRCGTFKSRERKSIYRLQQESAGQGFLQQDRTTTAKPPKMHHYWKFPALFCNI